jgi:hypothetical protein
MTINLQRWRTGLLAVLCVAVTAVSLMYYGWHLFTPKHRPLVRGIDNNYYFFWLPALIIEHDLDFGNQVANSPTLTAEDKKNELAEPLTATGLHANKFPIGWALTSAPWFSAAKILSTLCGWPSTGWEPIYQISIWLGQLTYAWSGLWFAWRVLSYFFPPLPASSAILVGWLASPLIYYQTAGLSMTHSLVFSLVAVAFWLSIKIYENGRERRWFGCLGFIAGLLLVTRYTAAFYLFFPLWVLVHFFRETEPLLHKIDCGITLLVCALPPIILQMAVWRILYGSWFVYSYGHEGFDLLHPHVFEILFSPLHGFFYWHPLMLIGLAGLLGWAAADKRIRLWVLSFAVALALNSCWWCWWFGGSFGYRSLEGAVFFTMGGLAWAFSQTAGHVWRSGLLWLTCFAAIGWNILLLALFLTKRIPGGSAVTWSQMWEAAVHWLG